MSKNSKNSHTIPKKPFVSARVINKRAEAITAARPQRSSSSRSRDQETSTSPPPQSSFIKKIIDSSNWKSKEYPANGNNLFSMDGEYSRGGINTGSDDDREGEIAVHFSSKLHPKPLTPKIDREPRGRIPWTDDEFRALEEGIAFYGPNWIAIKRDPNLAIRLTRRTNVDLKDKARNERAARERRGMDLGVFGSACTYNKTPRDN